MGIKERYKEEKQRRSADLMEEKITPLKASKIISLIIAAVFSMLLLFWLSTTDAIIVLGTAIIITSVIVYIIDYLYRKMH